MGFRRGAQALRQGHSWSNHPDQKHQVCTKCGIHRIKRTVRWENVIEYYLNDGPVTSDCPSCKGKSLYQQLMEEQL